MFQYWCQTEATDNESPVEKAGLKNVRFLTSCLRMSACEQELNYYQSLHRGIFISVVLLDVID